MNNEAVYSLHRNGNYKFFGSDIQHYSRFLGGKLEVILEEVNKKSGWILDIGTGNGLFLDEVEKAFNRIKAFGVTLSIPKRVAHRNIVISNAGKSLPFKDDSFDLVVSVFTILYIPDLTTTLMETRRVLKEDGVAYLHLGGREDIIVDGQSILLSLKNMPMAYEISLQHIFSTYYRVDLIIKVAKQTPIPELIHKKSEIVGSVQINYYKSTGRML